MPVERKEEATKNREVLFRVESRYSPRGVSGKYFDQTASSPIACWDQREVGVASEQALWPKWYLSYGRLDLLHIELIA